MFTLPSDAALTAMLRSMSFCSGTVVRQLLSTNWSKLTLSGMSVLPVAAATMPLTTE